MQPKVYSDIRLYNWHSPVVPTYDLARQDPRLFEIHQDGSNRQVVLAGVCRCRCL